METEKSMKEPFVSIISPTYNHEAYIGQCIESVIAQTYPHWEQIIIDDGSSDRTTDIVASYSDSRISLIRQKHQGPYHLKHTYNKALEQARGALIAILEGDDFWPPNKLEIQINTFKDPDIILSHGMFYRTGPNGKIVSEIRYPSRPVLNNDPIGSVTLHLLCAGSLSHSSTVMIKRDALTSIGGFQGDVALPFADTPSLMALGLLGKFLYVEELLGYHRYYRSSITLESPTWSHDWIEDMKVYAIKFYHDHKQDFRGRKVDELYIERQWEMVKHGRMIYKGRLALYERHWREALVFFSRAFASPSIKIKGTAMIGLFSAVTKNNLLEWCWKRFRGYEIRDLLDG